MNSTPTRPTVAELKAHIPLEMQERRAWVVWKLEMQDGRLTKIPYQCWLKRAMRAKSNDPRTWGYFGAALAVFEYGGYDGVSFALSADDPYTFVDLDHCRDPRTGDIEAKALGIIAGLSARVYAEISPSGEGVHIFMRDARLGKFAPEGRKRGDIEVYDQGRFSTMTGIPLLIPIPMLKTKESSYVEQR